MSIIHASLGILSLPGGISHFIFTLQIHELVTRLNDYSFSLYVYKEDPFVAWEEHTNPFVPKYDQSLAPWYCRKLHPHAWFTFKYRIQSALWCVDGNIKSMHRLIIMDYTGHSMWWSSANLLCTIGFNISQHGTLVPVQYFSGWYVCRF